MVVAVEPDQWTEYVGEDHTGQCEDRIGLIAKGAIVVTYECVRKVADKCDDDRCRQEHARAYPCGALPEVRHQRRLSQSSASRSEPNEGENTVQETHLGKSRIDGQCQCDGNQDPDTPSVPFCRLTGDFDSEQEHR